VRENGSSRGAGIRTALVHDFFVRVRGADRVFLEMCAQYPDADIFLPVYDEDGTEGVLSGRRVHTSFLQRMRPSSRTFRALLPFYPAAIESFDLSDFDVVLSSSSAWAHAAIAGEDAVHVCYCHNPFRYAWNERHRTLAERGDPISRAVFRSFFRRWRQWDWIAAQRVDRYLTNSRMTQARIKTYFGRDARVVYPPVDTGRFSPAQPADHYLVLSELVSHKRIDVAVEAFNRLRLPLVVAGDGPDRRRLRRLAGPNIKFAGRVSDAQANELLATCRALVLPAAEEFGIAAVEAQAAGRPVVARAAGGALETVVEGVTGCFWTGDSDDLTAAVAGFDTLAVDPRACADNAARFDSSVFRRELAHEVDSALRTPPEERPAGGMRARRPSHARRSWPPPVRPPS
jgi:glycosyltransferase involved in cell wall biosynthesis